MSGRSQAAVKSLSDRCQVVSITASNSVSTFRGLLLSFPQLFFTATFHIFIACRNKKIIRQAVQVFKMKWINLFFMAKCHEVPFGSPTNNLRLI